VFVPREPVPKSIYGDPANAVFRRGKARGPRYNLGLFDKLKYYVRRPQRFHHIATGEKAIMWDNFRFLDKGKGPEEPEDTSALPSLPVRILALVLLFLLTFGGSITYSSVGALASVLKEEYGISDSQYNTLFSIYSLPNIVTTFIAGLVVDKIGIHRTCTILTTTLVAGAVLAIYPDYYALLVGRFVYGIGNESIGVVQSYLLARWFARDRKVTLALATAVCLVSFRLAGFAALAMLPSVGAVSLVGANVLVAGMASLSAVAGTHIREAFYVVKSALVFITPYIVFQVQ